jgi:hypothetical protein
VTEVTRSFSSRLLSFFLSGFLTPEKILREGVRPMG